MVTFDEWLIRYVWHISKSLEGRGGEVVGMGRWVDGYRGCRLNGELRECWGIESLIIILAVGFMIQVSTR